METQNIRRQFLGYFKKNGHSIIPSSPVVPHDDPTLLFTNAGMNQFKDVFLGKSARDYKRAATSQKCIRVGGKHNDLDNVGHTRRHLTFFEMLGNFSFGDYFKKDAIKFAWEVATEVFQFEPERVWPTVFREDDEAFELWTHYVPGERITRFGEKDNFWAMGDTGPCGPCSELLYDRGSHYGKARNPSEDTTGERFLEFWNLVFMQYNRSQNGVMQPLPKPSIDTGAGLERIVSLKMNVDSVFETDVLRSIIAQVENLSHKKYVIDGEYGPAFRVIADHLRCLAFSIADGVQPSNVDRGYVLRKVLRRAVRYGRTLGFDKPFLAEALPALINAMGSDYQELVKGQNRIAEILTTEEDAFFRTLKRGGNLLNGIIEQARKKGGQISGDDAFKLKDTYGFPIEEIALLAKDGNLTVDTDRFQSLEMEAKERSRSSQKTTHQIAGENAFEKFVEKQGSSTFLGYNHNSSIGKVTALVVNGQFVDKMEQGQEGIVVLDHTPFYAEMGGQIGDIGTLKGETELFEVSDTIAPFKGVIGHVGTLNQGILEIGTVVVATIDGERRQRIANNHTATHLLHWALHQVLGEHVKQAGSVVDPLRLRFDFSHHKALTPEEVQKIEDLVNQKIRGNQPVKWYEIPYEQAQKNQEIKQFFGEKYGSHVRVIDIDYSKELCGGTHTAATGHIGLFRIAKESSIAAGVRRIEAVTGHDAELLVRGQEEILQQAANTLKTQPQKLLERLEKLQEENKALLQELKNSKKNQLSDMVTNLLERVEKVDHISLLAENADLTGEDLRTLADEIMGRSSSLLLVLASGAEDKAQILVRISDDLVNRGLKAGDIIKSLAPIIEGSGGGKPNSAQAGGKAPHKIAESLLKAKELVREYSRASQ